MWVGFIELDWYIVERFFLLRLWGWFWDGVVLDRLWLWKGLILDRLWFRFGLVFNWLGLWNGLVFERLRLGLLLIGSVLSGLLTRS